MRSNSAIGLLVLAGMLFGAVPEAVRSQTAALTIEDLSRNADVVVVGKVTEVRSGWSADRRIHTNVTLSIDQHIKGDASQNSVTIATLGGEVDGVGEVYSHMARFKQDEQVVVFAARDRQGQLRVVDGDQGKLTVTKERETGRLLVGNDESLTMFTSRLKAVVQAQARHE